MHLPSVEIFEAFSTNSVDPDQTAGSQLFASILRLSIGKTCSDVVILLAFKG